MTVVDEIDYEAPANPVQSLAQWRWWLVTGGGFVAGLVVMAGLVALPSPRSALAAPVQRQISFTLGGNVVGSSAVVVTRSGPHEQVSTAATYDSPTAAVLTVISMKGGVAMCRITVDGIAGPAETAKDGQAAVCVWSWSPTG